jgi:predicted PurR-regulated permease PerM
MLRSIVCGVISIIICSVISVFLVFPYMERSIINESKELAAEVKNLQNRLMNSNNNARLLNVEIDKLSNRNDELENIGKERVLNIMSMYKVGT